MNYRPKRVPISEALNGWPKLTPDDLLQALSDGAVAAWGLVDGAWRKIRPAWWKHINSPLDNTVWFSPAATEPPTPFRAERVEVSQEAIEKLWGEPGGVQSSRSVPALPKASLHALRKWAKERYPDGELPPRDDLHAEARKSFSGVREKDHIRKLRSELATESNKKGGAPRHRTRK
jgi:hypothetical protein